MSAVPVGPDLLRAMPLPTFGEGSKEERGRVLAVGGARELPGAVLLAGTAALRAGAGKLQIGTAASVAIPVALALPEAFVTGLPENPDGGLLPEAADRIVALAGKAGALLLGPGLLVDDDMARLTRRVLDALPEVPVVLDAAAMMRILDHAPALSRHRGRLLVTPHAGEMAGMLGVPKEEVERDPAGIALRTAARLGIVVVLKGACSVIALPDGRAWSCRHGNPGLATSGSGDVLAGTMAGLLARGAEPAVAAVWAVYLHGEAGERLARRIGPLGYLARELPAEIPAALGALCAGASP